jgi:hypothetical protein
MTDLAGNNSLNSILTVLLYSTVTFPQTAQPCLFDFQNHRIRVGQPGVRDSTLVTLLVEENFDRSTCLFA